MTALPREPPSFPPFVSPPLPSGWTEHQAPGGQTYYYHASTNQSTYTRPLPGIPFPVPSAMSFVSPGAVIPGATPPKEKKKKERPLVKTPVPGTQWLRVRTTEGNVFWTHRERKESLWEIPEEIRELAEKMEQDEKTKRGKEIQAREQQERVGHQRGEDEILRREREEVERVMGEVRDAVAAGKRKATESAEEAEMDGHKKPRLEEELDEEHDEALHQKMAEEMLVESVKEGDDIPEHQALTTEHVPPSNDQDSRQDSAGPDAIGTNRPSFKVPDRVDLSIDESKALFKTLLQEKNINPLHPWDTSLPLFISDPRYVLLPSVSARREAFDEYCRDAVRARRAAKTASLKEDSERAVSVDIGEDGGKDEDKDKGAYARLLREEVVSTRTTWHEFRRKWKKDRRFFGWASDRERERLFRDWLRGLADLKKKQAEKAEREFFQLLREHKEIKPDDVWKEIDPKDSRYDAVGSSSLREELFTTYVRTLRETITRDVQTQYQNTGGAHSRNIIVVDARHDDAEAARRRQRAERAERGLREREEKVRLKREGLEREIGRTRGAVGREEGEREFMTLLTDAVRDPQAQWDFTVLSLSCDPRFVLCALPLTAQRTLFSEHVARLRQKHLAGLHVLFAAHALGLSTQWHDLDASAKKAIRGSVAVEKLGFADTTLDSESDDATRSRLEAEFDRWQRTRNADARQAFDTMLGENAFLEFWGRMGKVSGDVVGDGSVVPDDGEDEEEGEGGGGRADLKTLARSIDIDEVGKVLKNDSRWTAFDHVPKQREQWLKDYMERLAAPKLSVHVPDKEKA